MLFLPANCPVCGKRLFSPGEVICLRCEQGLPRTGFRDNPENRVNMIFWGRVPVEIATSLLGFEKGSAYQSLLHDLKYRQNRRVGYYLGRLLGEELKESSYSVCDMLIPVPLHPKKYRTRGYNQSELIARGASGVLDIPVIPDLLLRSVHHESQTRLGRYERYENVAGSFQLSKKAADLNGSRILLIDDVITTGSTLEACVKVLVDSYHCRVYVATISCA